MLRMERKERNYPYVLAIKNKTIEKFFSNPAK
jgi:hypothetical protein